jgi:hypothetical protein
VGSVIFITSATKASHASRGSSDGSFRIARSISRTVLFSETNAGAKSDGISRPQHEGIVLFTPTKLDLRGVDFIIVALTGTPEAGQKGCRINGLVQTLTDLFNNSAAYFH